VTRMVGMLIGGDEVFSDRAFDVENPFDGSVLARVPEAAIDQVDRALAAAEEGARAVGRMSRSERSAVLDRVSGALADRVDEFARLIASESGKTLKEARGEVTRAVETFRLSADEARRLAGEIVPIDGAPTGADRFGFFLRVPLGVIVAITPFNFPLNLAAHKVGPAIAAGNAVVLKPSSYTPLTGIELGRLLLESGLPPEASSSRVTATWRPRRRGRRWEPSLWQVRSASPFRGRSCIATSSIASSTASAPWPRA